MGEMESEKRTSTLGDIEAGGLHLAKLGAQHAAPLPRELFHGYRFGQVARLVYVAATAHRDVIGQQLQRHDLQQGG